MKFPWTRVLVLVILVVTFITVNVMDDQRLLLREVSQGFFHIDSPLAGLVPFAVVFIVLTVAFFTNFSKVPSGTEED